ncbi:MEKHLA domain-containing protein [Saccharopolyspora indica]|uniref:MEKHLA domain-containing protein n=1 Tax=Saccharopolyspora indica TaxID=1229659 RepID=UPI0022EB6545|nr:MEKHLA domain-containing protein [Saccharopolyspora indica]MDA3647893.1 hypothetical protein [Saccharopolyspora indica]
MTHGETERHGAPPDGTALFRCIEGSFRSIVGGELVPLERDDDSRRRWLYERAPFGVLAHESGSDLIRQWRDVT